jgi:hypothetical protein
MAYGDWMNGLQGMTTALGAASPYAQQLAQNNAQQANLAQMIRAGAFNGFGGNYPTQPGVTYGGGAPMAPQPYSMPTPFTGFADVLKPRLQPQPLPINSTAPTLGSSYRESPGTGDESYGMTDGPSAHYDNWRDWLANMKELPGWLAQFTPSGMARSVYESRGFDPLLRAVGLENLAAGGKQQIAQYSSPEQNYGSTGETYSPVSPEVAGRPDWWNEESLRAPTGNASQQAIRDWSNRVNAAAEAEQYGILPGLTGNAPPALTSSNAPIPYVESAPLPDQMGEALARIAELSSPQQSQPEVYGPQTWAGLLSDQYAAQAEEEQNPDRSPWEGWYQTDDSGTWYRD